MGCAGSKAMESLKAAAEAKMAEAKAHVEKQKNDLIEVALVPKVRMNPSARNGIDMLT
jgi:hypothetical protein